eukprot:TRINITY_DN9180_c0_g2_i2.p2 TRINITY_DN9180_c0_g2~~TRINITY_DN9180_c0_g2_i2.p2  ORF type:complete len:214 (+),score=-16.03 TRINITY_DN9180_c0_g2_i2:400-1041(+)
MVLELNSTLQIEYAFLFKPIQCGQLIVHIHTIFLGPNSVHIIEVSLYIVLCFDACLKCNVLKIVPNSSEMMTSINLTRVLLINILKGASMAHLGQLHLLWLTYSSFLTQILAGTNQKIKLISNFATNVKKYQYIFISYIFQFIYIQGFKLFNSCSMDSFFQFYVCILDNKVSQRFNPYCQFLAFKNAKLPEITKIVVLEKFILQVSFYCNVKS